MDINNDDDHAHEDVSEDAVEQVPVEEVGAQITPRFRELEQEEVATMLDEEAFHGADLAGGEGEIPFAILRVTDPVVRRELLLGGRKVQAVDQDLAWTMTHVNDVIEKQSHHHHFQLALRSRRDRPVP